MVHLLLLLRGAVFVGGAGGLGLSVSLVCGGEGTSEDEEMERGGGRKTRMRRRKGRRIGMNETIEKDQLINSLNFFILLNQIQGKRRKIEEETALRRRRE